MHMWCLGRGFKASQQTKIWLVSWTLPSVQAQLQMAAAVRVAVDPEDGPWEFMDSHHCFRNQF